MAPPPKYTLSDMTILLRGNAVYMEIDFVQEKYLNQ